MTYIPNSCLIMSGHDMTWHDISFPRLNSPTVALQSSTHYFLSCHSPSQNVACGNPSPVHSHPYSHYLAPPLDHVHPLLRCRSRCPHPQTARCRPARTKQCRNGSALRSQRGTGTSILRRRRCRRRWRCRERKESRGWEAWVSIYHHVVEIEDLVRDAEGKEMRFTIDFQI